ncbi:MAG TPA: hypothetical protein VHF27_12950, partial [Acidimicrobiales bacterium]|nr:hypothetical protein [Acidimicrobiales bacterium]
VAAGVLLAPTAAGASDENVAVATNQTDGAAVAEASVQFRMAPNGVIDEENTAHALASCGDCQTLAVAFQLVLVPRDFHTLVPRNEAVAGNLACEECLTWASAKQVFVVTGGPASLTGAGHQRIRDLEARVEALEAELPTLTLAELAAEVDAAFEELLDVARTEVRRHDGGPQDAEVVATRSS